MQNGGKLKTTFCFFFFLCVCGIALKKRWSGHGELSGSTVHSTDCLCETWHQSGTFCHRRWWAIQHALEVMVNAMTPASQCHYKHLSWSAKTHITLTSLLLIGTVIIILFILMIYSYIDHKIRSNILCYITYKELSAKVYVCMYVWIHFFHSLRHAQDYHSMSRWHTSKVGHHTYREYDDHNSGYKSLSDKTASWCGMLWPYLVREGENTHAISLWITVPPFHRLHTVLPTVMD